MTSRHVPELWICGVGGISRHEFEAVGADGHHNWADGNKNPEYRRVGFWSLRSGRGAPPGDPNDSTIVGNEPNVDSRNADTDAYPNTPREAGTRAAEVAVRQGVRHPIVGNLLETSERATDVGYWTQYIGGYVVRLAALQDMWTRPEAVGVHYYYRDEMRNDLRTTLEDVHWAAGEADVYLTELGIDRREPPSWQWWAGEIEGLLDWSADKPWLKAITLVQWPWRGHVSTLWLNTSGVVPWPGALTSLGIEVRDMWELARIEENNPEPPTVEPEPEPEQENGWTVLSVANWAHEGWEYEATVKARRVE